MNKYLYQRQINLIEQNIVFAKKLYNFNSELIGYNWIFLHPYSQGGHIEVLEKQIKESKNPDATILKFFAREFLDLRFTIHIIDGIYRERPFLKDYVNTIEESVVLCLQKDFKAAISVLLPVIEGTLRKYLVSKKGETKARTTGIDKLVIAFDLIANDYAQLHAEYLKKENQHLLAIGEYLDTNQQKNIADKHKEYINLWLYQLKHYLQNNLYFKSRGNININDTFNRNLISHGMDEKTEYSFANYLRLFNCIHFLSWALGNTYSGGSPFSEVDEDKVTSKWVDYLNIMITAEALNDVKSRILGKTVLSFNDYLPYGYSKLTKTPIKNINEIVKGYSFALRIVDKSPSVKISTMMKFFRWLR